MRLLFAAFATLATALLPSADRAVRMDRIEAGLWLCGQLLDDPWRLVCNIDAMRSRSLESGDAEA